MSATRTKPEMKLKSRFSFDDCALDGDTRQLHRGGRLIHLPRLPFDVLLYLVEMRPLLVRREELLARFWRNRPGGDEALTRCMSSIRKALGDMDEPTRMIETRRAEGYRFIAEVTQPSPELQCDIDRPVAKLGAASLRTVAMTPRVARVMAAITVAGICALVGAMWWAPELAGQTPARKVKILWVDDHPERNAIEISTLTAAGAIVDTARSNAEAAIRLVGRQYDLVISDIKREHPQARHAGLDLPRELAPDRNRLPPVVYYVGTLTDPSTPDGYPITARRAELFQLITDAVKWKTGETLVIDSALTGNEPTG